eukprot:5770098-Pleurochrysis_carterae.AAC.1
MSRRRRPSQQVQKIRDETEKFRHQRQSRGVHAQQVISDETFEDLEEDEEAIYNTAAQPPRGTPFHLRDTRPTAPSSRNAGRPPLRSESRNLANFKPINQWEELPANVRAELERRGIKSGDDPRYLDKTPPCIACGRETHPVGWCPYIWLQMPRSGKSQEWVQRGQTQMIWSPIANKTLINCVQEVGLEADNFADEDLVGLALDPVN